MKSLTFINESQRDWQPISPSNLTYSIDWNSRDGRVKLTLPNGTEFFSEKNVPSAVAEITGEKMLENTVFSHLLKRREYNGRIEVIKLG